MVIHELKAKQLNKNEKYAYWVLHPSESGNLLFAGARKLWAFKVNGVEDVENNYSLDKGPRMNDTDADHVQSIHIQNGMVVITRRDWKKCKIFNTSSGKLLGCKTFKATAVNAQFAFDNENCIVCIQKQDGKKVGPLIMHSWKF